MISQFDKSEKIVVIIYILIVVLMLLNPPWAYFNQETGKFLESIGTYFILNSPQPEAQIHHTMLIYRIFVLGILLASIIAVLRITKMLWNRSITTKENETIEVDSLQKEELYISESPTILRRYLSTFIDAVFISVIFIAVSFIFQGDSSYSNIARVGTLYVMICIYEPFMTSCFCTLGQKITKIRVRTATTHEHISIPAAYLRVVVKILLGLISFFTIPISKNRRAIHDFASGSVVIKV